MNSLKKTFFAAFLFIASLTSVHAENHKTSSLELRLQQLMNEQGETTRLHHLFDLYWEWRMEENPDEATFWGYPGKQGHWPQLTEEAILNRQSFTSQLLNILNSIPLNQLPENDRDSYFILKRILEEDLACTEFGSHYLLVNQMHGMHLHVPLIIELMPHGSVKDYEDILSRLRRLPEFFQQTIQLLDKGLELKITPPRIALLKVPQQVLNQIFENPIDSPLLKAFQQFPSSIDPEKCSELASEAQEVYRNIVFPAYLKLYNYLSEEYIPNCRRSIAFSDLPRGREWYTHHVQSSTTTSLTPQEIHLIGLKEVQRIHNEMKEIIQSSPFKGSFEEFLNFIETDPQFFYSNREDLLHGYRTLTKYIESKLSLLFAEFPTLPFEVIPIPAYSEESQIGAYYCPGSLANGRPGYFYINTSYPEKRPKWEMEPLALHEAVPGHHLQISLAQELNNIPEFRKNSTFTAYVEGWGLYAESLGAEFGLYRDCYSNFGRLTYEMLRAIRLVVDTGMHALGWTREEAIQFFKKYVGMSDHEISTEVDRYLVLPGQALAYKIGELKLKEMRSLAGKQLGDRFDIRAFHTAWLQNGTLPLDIAEQKIHEWILKTLEKE